MHLSQTPLEQQLTHVIKDCSNKAKRKQEVWKLSSDLSSRRSWSLILALLNLFDFDYVLLYSISSLSLITTFGLYTPATSFLLTHHLCSP